MRPSRRGKSAKNMGKDLPGCVETQESIGYKVVLKLQRGGGKCKSKVMNTLEFSFQEGSYRDEKG